jgi:hypothetical protein
LTRGRAATPEPFDLGAVAGSDELFEALSSRRLADLDTGGPGRSGNAGPGDPAAALLAALVTDVDNGAPPLPAPARATCGLPGARRRSVRAFVTLGVAALVLTSAGAAAAGGGHGPGVLRTPHGSMRLRIAERSNVNAHRQVAGAPLADRHASATHHPGDRHPGTTSSPQTAPDARADEPRNDHAHRPSHSHTHTPAGNHGKPGSHGPSTPPDDITPSPVAESLALLH